jgi:hypothetical protein
MQDAEQNVNGGQGQKSETKVHGEEPSTHEEEVDEEDWHEEEATNHGAAGTLTGTEERAFQEP